MRMLRHWRYLDQHLAPWQRSHVEWLMHFPRHGALLGALHAHHETAIQFWWDAHSHRRAWDPCLNTRHRQADGGHAAHLHKHCVPHA